MGLLGFRVLGALGDWGLGRRGFGVLKLLGFGLRGRDCRVLGVTVPGFRGTDFGVACQGLSLGLLMWGFEDLRMVLRFRV